MLLKALAALAVVSVVALALYLARGVMLTPVHTDKNIKVTVTVETHGHAPGLEYTVDGLLWLRQSGALPASIVILDKGMDEETRAVAETLSRDLSVSLTEQYRE